MTLPGIILTRELAALGMDSQLRSWIARGEVRRIGSGAYVRADALHALGKDDRYRLLVRATALLFPDTQFSHDSAAALWRLPSLGRWPQICHAVGVRETGGRSNSRILRHGTGVDLSPAVIDDVTVTCLPRTLADVASQRSFARAIVMLDRGFGTSDDGAPGPTKEAVREQLMDLRSHARAERAIDFADGAAGSPGESLSRAQFRALGLPAPRLQVPFYDSDGHIGDTDFYWEEIGLAGEFDGNVKYGDARRFDRHLSAEEVVLAEKRREDRLRRVVKGVVRWGWSLALDRHALAAHLAAHGLTPQRKLRDY